MSEKSSENRKVTLQQKQAIVDFMQENYSFLMGKFSGMEGRMKKNLKWKEFGDVLNKLGPPMKDLAKWKKTWADLKSETKKKYQLKRQNLHTSGAGPIDIVFSQLDERIAQICGRQLMDGDAEINEIGFDSNDGEDIVFIESEESEPMTLTPLNTKSVNKTPVKKTPVKSARKRLYVEDEETLSGFPDDETSNTPKRTYRSQNSQVDLALSLQQKQITLLERIVVQNDSILEELKKIEKHQSNQNSSFFHY